MYVSEGMLRLYDKQNSNTWLHVDMKFSSRVQLDISLVRFSYSWAIELNTRREIPYLRAPMYYYLCISSELTRFFRLVSVFRRIARFWTCNFSWSCHMISGRKLLYTKLQWIVLKEHSDWLLKFRKSFAIYLWATRAGFIVIVAGTNKAKFCAPLPHFLVYAVLKQLLTSASAARGGYLLRSFVAREISTTITSTSQ